MPRQTKVPTTAGEASPVNEKVKKAKDPNGKNLDYLCWAWKFLRRNPEYKLLYGLSVDGPSGREKALDILAIHPITRALPIELFDVYYPECVYGDTFGSWIDRSISEQQGCEFNESDIYDPRRFGLATWIDPAIESLDEIKNVFDLSLLELDEAWAINFKSEEQNKEFEFIGPSPRDFVSSLGMTATKPTQIAIKFDLRLPLDSQLEQARRQLQNAVSVYRDKTKENWHQIPDWDFKTNREDSWEDGLKLLDLQCNSTSNIDLFRRFEGKSDLQAFEKPAKRLEPLLKTAVWYRDVGYRSLILKGLGDTPALHWKMKKREWETMHPPVVPVVKKKQTWFSGISTTTNDGQK